MQKGVNTESHALQNPLQLKRAQSIKVELLHKENNNQASLFQSSTEPLHISKAGYFRKATLSHLQPTQNILNSPSSQERQLLSRKPVEEGPAEADIGKVARSQSTGQPVNAA